MDPGINNDDTCASFGGYFRQTLFPRQWLGVVFTLTALFAGVAYWLVAQAYHPEEPLEAKAMYRVGDHQYFPGITQLARLQFGEAINYENLGERIRSSRMPAYFFHSLFYYLLGTKGFIAADAVVTLLYFSLVVALLRYAGITRVLANAAGLFIVCGLHRYVNEFLSNIIGPERQVLWFWSFRLLRPFVTEMFFFAFLALVLDLVSKKQDRPMRFSWVGAGVCLALLVQTEFHLAIGLVLGLPALFVWTFIAGAKNKWPLLVGWGSFLLAFLIFMIPFFIQRLNESPDFPVRLGVFSVPRSRILYAFKPVRLLLALAFAAVGFSAIRYGSFAREEAKRGQAKKFLVILTVICFLANIALPVSAWILAKTVHTGNFWEVFARISSLLFLFSSLYALEVIFEAMAKQLKKKGYGVKAVIPALGVMICLLSLLSTFFLNARLAKYEGFFNYAYVKDPEIKIPHYRGSFSDLLVELSKKKYKRCEVLGTFDHQFFTWWVTFRGGYSVLAEAFNTTRHDTEIEDRLMFFCRTLALSPAEFENFVDRWWFNYCWLGLFKYNATKAHTYAPIEEYSPEAREEIEQFNIWRTAYITMPRGERNRLREKYLRYDYRKEKYRLDLIVLAKVPPFADLRPPDGEFRLVYQNQAFRVWCRKTLVGLDNKEKTH